MLTLIIRAIIVYLLVLLVFRLMGKRQIGQMQPFELVLTLVIADLATIPMAESAIPTLNGVVPLITLVVVHFFLTLLSKKSPKISNIISGKPVIIIDPNGINFEAIEKLNITVDDIFEAIRSQGYFKLEDIRYAIMETNGTVSVLPKASISPATAQDLKLSPQETYMPVTIISEGNLLAENLPLINLNERFIDEVLKKQNVSDRKNVLALTIDKVGACYLQEKDKGYKTFQVEVPNE